MCAGRSGRAATDLIAKPLHAHGHEVTHLLSSTREEPGARWGIAEHRDDTSFSAANASLGTPRRADSFSMVRPETNPRNEGEDQ